MSKGIFKADVLSVVPINVGVGRPMGTELQIANRVRQHGSAFHLRDGHSLSVDISGFLSKIGLKRMSNISSQFGFAVRKLRKQQHLTQEELANRCGLHRTYLTDIERGARNPSLKIIERIAGGLETSIAGLMRAMEDKKVRTARS